MIIRASSINAALRCPGILGLQTAASPATEAGTRFHAYAAAHVTERAYNGPIEPGWAEWAAWWDSLGLGPANDTERECRLDIGGHTVTGHIDAYWSSDEGYLVADWKWTDSTLGYLPPIADDLQMIAYGCMVSEMGERVAVIRPTCRDRQLGEVLEITPEHRDRLLAVLDEIAAHAGEFRPGPDCEHCLARGSCQSYQDQAHLLVPMRLAAAPITDASAGRLMVAVGAARELADRVEEMVKGHVRAGGRVEIGGRAWTPSPVSSERIVDGNAVYRHLVAAGVDVGSVAEIRSRKAVEAAASDAGLDVDNLWETLVEAGAVSVSQSERWVWRRTR